MAATESEDEMVGYLYILNILKKIRHSRKDSSDYAVFLRINPCFNCIYQLYVLVVFLCAALKDYVVAAAFNDRSCGNNCKLSLLLELFDREGTAVAHC